MEFESLCEVYQHRKTFQGFRGTLGACPQAVFVIGERPSWNDSYAGAVTDLIGRRRVHTRPWKEAKTLESLR
jgi:hypothetical protein